MSLPAADEETARIEALDHHFGWCSCHAMGWLDTVPCGYCGAWFTPAQGRVCDTQGDNDITWYCSEDTGS